MCNGSRLTLDFSARHVDYGYDAASRLKTVSNPLVTPNVPLLYAYSGDSQVASGCLDANANGLCDTGETTTTYPRDTAGRLSELLNAAGAGTLSDFVYTLDPLGNRTDAVETLTLPGQASLPAPHIYADAAPAVFGQPSEAQTAPLLQPLLDALKAAYDSGAIHSASLYDELRGKVEEAQKAIDRGQCDTALNNLQAFLNDVDAQSGKGIDPSTAEQLSTLATAAINTLDCVPAATPSSTPEPSSTPTATPTSTDTPTPTASSTPTATDTPTPTATAMPSATETPTPTVTASATGTKSPSATPSKTPTLTPTLAPTKTPKPTATPKPTSTPAPQSPGPSVKSAPLGPNVLLSGSTTYHWHYQYDKLQRLTYACSDWNGTACVGSVFNYAYDGAGNLTSFDKWNGSAVETVHYKYNGANQIQCVDANNNNQCGDTGDIAYTYDAYGNLTNDGSSTYTYDAASRLISVVKSGITTSYTYDGDGNRLSQTVGTTTTTYVIDTATPLTMVLSETTGGVTTYYWQGLDTLGQSDGTNTKYFAYDGLGSVRQLTDSSASVLLAQTFDPYGNGFSTAGTATTSLGFTGEQTDSNGFVFLRARYYQPGMGRFLNTDPSRQEQNPYLYAAGSPVMFIDPGGYLPCERGPWNAQGNCLLAIRDRIWKLIYGGYGKALSEGDNGYALATDLLKYYLSAKGGVIWISPNRFDKKMMDYIGQTVASDIAAGPIKTELMQWKMFLDPCFALGFTFYTDTSFDEQWNDETLNASGAPWGYHSAIGRAIYHSYKPGRVDVTVDDENHARALVATEVEFYDHYDWCFGSYCPATGEQGPADHIIFVGEFFALEKAKMAAQFGWYSAWMVYSLLNIKISGDSIAVDSGRYIGWDPVANYADFEEISGKYQPQFKDIGIQKVTDDWPTP